LEKKLFVIVNQTNQKFKFVNKECDTDGTEIQPCASSNLPSINLTPGKHFEGCDIPDCSDEKYYDQHHMAFTEGADDKSVFSFWYDDWKNQYYYSKSDSYTGATVIPGNVSSTVVKKAIYIQDDGTLFITDIN
jgi:hypothetical protein